MTDRTDRYSAGKVEPTALTPRELARADAVEQVIGETRGFLDARPAPNLVGSVMRQIEQRGLRPQARPESVPMRAARALWAARVVSFRWRPAYGLLAVAAGVMLAVLLGGERRASPDASAPSTAAAVETRLFVQFRFQAPEATTVQLAGSFTDWQPRYELLQTAPGNWTVTLPLPPGVHDYSFVVDGQWWMPDPFAPSVSDGFGGTNSRLALLPPESSRL